MKDGVVGICLLALVGMLACARPGKGTAASEQRRPETPNVMLSLSNESQARGSVTLAVYVDGKLAARRCVSNGGPMGVCSPPLRVPLALPPGPHTLRVVAVGQIACASQEIVVGCVPLYVHAAYEWAPGGRRGRRIPERVSLVVQDEPFGFC